jgi:cell wall-associated NlpC family hydrolase
MGKTLAVLAAVLLAIPLLAIAALTGLGDSLTGPVPSTRAATDIPPAYQRFYLTAAATCPGLPWTVLAAAGKAETDHGRDPAWVSTAAEGPMRLLPATFAAYAVDGDGDGRTDPDDPADAISTAARYLCAVGARDGANIPGAPLTSSGGDPADVARILTIATTYTDTTTGEGAGGDDTASPAGPAALAAVDYATAQLGLPYQWAGNGDPGWDCSGLTHAAYAAADVTIPRTAQTQYDAGPHLDPATPLAPGDLAFFGPQPGDVTHVGVVISNQNGQTVMIDAPHHGATVRTESFPTTIGAAWGTDDMYLGATRPTAA